MTTKLDLSEQDNKDLLREKVAQDIRAYLAKGGVVTKYSRGASVYDDPLTKGWGLKPKIIRTKKGTTV